MSAPRVWAVVRALAAALLLLTGGGGCRVAEDGGAAALRETPPELLRTLGTDEPGLYQIRDAAFLGGTLAVLTSPAPAVHLFSSAGQRNWGEKGSGPAELENPGDAEWAGAHLLVRDFRLGKIVGYDSAGTLVSTRTYAPLMVNRLEVAGSDTIVVAFTPTGTRTLLRLRGEQHDTVLVIRASSEKIDLQAPGSPSLTLSPPYAPEAVWALLSDGRVAYWDGRAADLRLLDLMGRAVGTLPLPSSTYRVQEADRQGWFDEAIPSAAIGGEVDPFKGLRTAAREQVRFPERMPLVLGLVADPAGGVWVQRAPATSGEVWTYLDARGPRRSLRLAPGRELLAVGTGELAATARDEMDREIVEIYRKPGS